MDRYKLHGIIASAALLIVYVVILTLVESFDHALRQFADLWYLMTPLVIGFGIQIGLYSYIRAGVRALSLSGAGTSVAASGGVSTGSMVLCCLHHVTDVLPLIGLTAAALFLSQYQGFFLVLGIFSNVVGIIMMFHIMQRNNMHPKVGTFSGIFKHDMRQARNNAILLSAVFLFVIFIFSSMPTPVTAEPPTNTVNNPPSSGLGKLVNDENSVAVDVTPVDFEFGKEVVFDIGINTHSGSLDFDVAEIATLKDSDDNTYPPDKWEGSPPGGHHSSGRLFFPSIEETEYIELSLKDINNVPERLFRWELGG
jgi:hypothetical protein